MRARVSASSSVAHIADEIQRNLDFLATTQRDVTEGQRSLRAVFDSSHRRLSQAEQDTFAQLSVFQGGFAEEAASALIAGSARSVLISLMDKSLLRRNAAGRYDLHEMVRQCFHCTTFWVGTKKAWPCSRKPFKAWKANPIAKPCGRGR